MGISTVGLIVPPQHGKVPPEGEVLYRGAVRFTAVGLGLERLSSSGYDSVISRTEDLAQQLVAEGADVVALMGTSLTFYRGWAFHDWLQGTLRASTGVSVTTMSAAVVEALDVLGAQRIAVATAYTGEVNERLRSFLEETGVQVASLEGLNVVDVERAQAIGQEEIVRLCDRSVSEARAGGAKVDALFVSCGALRTLHLLPQLEDKYGFPVVASNPAGFWGAVRLVGHSGASPGNGRLFEQEVSCGTVR